MPVKSRETCGAYSQGFIVVIRDVVLVEILFSQVSIAFDQALSALSVLFQLR